MKTCRRQAQIWSTVPEGKHALHVLVPLFVQVYSTSLRKHVCAHRWLKQTLSWETNQCINTGFNITTITIGFISFLRLNQNSSGATQNETSQQQWHKFRINPGHKYIEIIYTYGEALGPTRAPNISWTTAAFRLWLAVNVPFIITNAIRFTNVRPFGVNLISKSNFNVFKEPNHKTALISYIITSVYTLTCFLWFKWIEQKLHNR